jgi:hypothetical protein
MAHLQGERSHVFARGSEVEMSASKVSVANTLRAACVACGAHSLGARCTVQCVLRGPELANMTTWVVTMCGDVLYHGFLRIDHRVARGDSDGIEAMVRQVFSDPDSALDARGIIRQEIIRQQNYSFR